MSENISKRLLEAFIHLEVPVLENVEAIKSIEETSGDPVPLTDQDLIRAISRYQGRTISLEDLTEWAQAIELREDIAFEFTRDDYFDLFYALANPSINPDLSSRIEGLPLN